MLKITKPTKCGLRQPTASLLAIASFVIVAAASPAFAQYTLNTLASFNGANGAYPDGGLVLAGDTLYGATTSGGVGTVFSLPASGGTLRKLASFNGGDGNSPGESPVLMGTTLYGTTSYGGDN